MPCAVFFVPLQAEDVRKTLKIVQIAKNDKKRPFHRDFYSHFLHAMEILKIVHGQFSINLQENAMSMDNFQCPISKKSCTFAAENRKVYETAIVNHTIGGHPHRLRRLGHLPLYPCLLAQHTARRTGPTQQRLIII